MQFVQLVQLRQSKQLVQSVQSRFPSPVVLVQLRFPGPLDTLMPIIRPRDRAVTKIGWKRDISWIDWDMGDVFSAIGAAGTWSETCS